MGKLNQNFRYNKSFDAITLLVFIVFLALFAKSIIMVMGAFETELYTNTIAELSRVNYP